MTTVVGCCPWENEKINRTNENIEICFEKLRLIVLKNYCKKLFVRKEDIEKRKKTGRINSKFFLEKLKN